MVTGNGHEPLHTQPPRLRVVDRSTIDVVLGFMRELSHEGGAAFDGRSFDEAAHRAALLDLLADESLGCAWLIETDEQAVGYVILTLGYSLEFHGRNALVDELYLVEEARGQGIGTAVLGLLEEICRRFGVRALHLEVDRENVRAQALYRRVGYLDHDRYLLTKRLDA